VGPTTATVQEAPDAPEAPEAPEARVDPPADAARPSLSDPGAPSEPSEPSIDLKGLDAKATRSRTGRLEFLDVLRGLAAMAVVVQHVLEQVSLNYLKWSEETFRPGEFGVAVFFMVSGFIIPASIERYDSLRKFWVGRVFRLFPLYWAVVLAAFVLHYVFGVYPMLPEATENPVSNLLWNMTMMQDFVNIQWIVGASWTLSYEMVFYLLISVLFVVGLHRRSAALSMLATASTVVLGLFLPASVLVQFASLPSGERLHYKPMLVLLMVTAAAVGMCIVYGRGRGRTIAAVAICLVTIPLLFNQPRDMWFSLGLFSFMFAGSLFYRMLTGDLAARTGWVLALLMVGTVTANFLLWVVPGPGPLGAYKTAWPEIFTYLGGFIFFAVFFLLRHLSFPRVLMWLGKVSFSVYLVHGVIIGAVPRLEDVIPGIPGKLATMLLWVVVTVGVSAATYYFIELPGQRLGKRYMKGRSGSESRSERPATAS
jgi:peptidoglycan/LPS O-acetylase OafA/YrhL